LQPNEIADPPLHLLWATPFHDTRGRFRRGPWRTRGSVLCAVFTEDVLRIGDHLAALTLRGTVERDVVMGLGRAEAPPAEVEAALLEAAAPDWGRPAIEAAEDAGDLAVRVFEYDSTGPRPGPDTEALVPRLWLADGTVFNEFGFGAAPTGSAEPEAQEAGRPHRHRTIRVTFSRPFAYLVRDRASGAVARSGWVADPIEHAVRAR
jgi:hypothetical protein